MRSGVGSEDRCCVGRCVKMRDMLRQVLEENKASSIMPVKPCFSRSGCCESVTSDFGRPNRASPQLRSKSPPFASKSLLPKRRKQLTSPKPTSSPYLARGDMKQEGHEEHGLPDGDGRRNPSFCQREAASQPTVVVSKSVARKVPDRGLDMKQ